ncbi:MAG TPA: OprO/OprP family phosphate-selective porin [Allosphingosinicella sp.]|nr:OprO/OprP family phosphate-selective porin [Allosphingosinicella sp.]
MRTFFHAALLSATFLSAVPARAQTGDVAAEISALRAELQAVNARLEAVESRASRAEAALAQAQTQSAAAALAAAVPAPAPASAPEIRFSGAPQIRAPGGWSFKPRGRLQFDVGNVGSPDGITDRSLGFGNEVRRARLGVEGSIPGGFGYVFELDFADNNVEIVDALLSYRASDSASLTIGQHNNFQSLEELTSSRFTSFIERAAFTDAFNFERRVGVSAAFTSGDLIAQAGLFTDNIADLDNDENDAVSLDGRIVFAPELGDTRLHLGASAHWRDHGDLAAAGSTIRYRQRPLVHFTDVRFVATPALPVEQETSYGLEAAVIRGPLHAAAEAHWLKADLTTSGQSANFFGGYAEIGYFLTGETRGYRSGRFDRTSVRRPVGGDEGGFGAVQVNLRYDFLDLNSRGIIGGTQNGLQASLVWIPTDYVRLLLNYGRMQYDDAAIPAAGGDRDYAVDVIGARAQIDF